VRRLSAADAEQFIRGSTFVWHQRFELGPGVYTPGTSDVEWLLDRAGVSLDLTGKTVLDIGCANAGAAFEAERRGASRIVAFDMVPPEWFGVNVLTEFLDSRVEFIQGNLYDLARAVDGEQFDVVFVFGVLYHLRHPLLGLDNIYTVVKPEGEAVLETAVADHRLGDSAHLPVAWFFRLQELNEDPSNWFAPTVRALADWGASAGFAAEILDAWPNLAPQRAMVRLRRAGSVREFESISYERTIRGVPAATRDVSSVTGETAAP